MLTKVLSALPGIGVAVLTFLLDKQVDKVEDWQATVGYVAAGLIIVGGLWFSLRQSKPERSPKVVDIGDDAVVTFDQKGGQAARTIVNVGCREKRQLPPTGPAVARLSQFPKVPYTLAFMGLDEEAQSFAYQIDAMLQEAGWEKVGTPAAMLLSTMRHGVALRWSDDNGHGEAMQSLMDCLSEMGFEVQRMKGKNHEYPDIFVRSTQQ